MNYSGTIKRDGGVVLHGCVPSDTRLVGITRRLIAIKHPGGRWWDNGGEHYTKAWVEVRELDRLEAANEPDEYIFHIKKIGLSMDFHPTPKVAQANATEDVRDLFERMNR